MQGDVLKSNSNGAGGVVSWFSRKSKEAPAVPSAVHGALEMHKPWARAASSRHQPRDLAAAFVSITNKGPDDDRLVGASSPLAERIDLHGIKVVGAVIHMRPMANGVVVQAGHTTTLKPRGYHLLVHGVQEPLAKGSMLPLTLTFEKAGAVSVEFVVEDPGLVGEAVLNEEHHRG